MFNRLNSGNPHYTAVPDGRSEEVTECEQAQALANKILARINADPDDDLAVLARQFLRARERELNFYVRALRLSHDSNQTCGEKHDYYITLDQLERLVRL